MKIKSYTELCKDWGIDPEENRNIFEWLKSDPRDEQGRLTREVGLRKPGEKVEMLDRVINCTGTHFRSREYNDLFPRGLGVQVSAIDFYF